MTDDCAHTLAEIKDQMREDGLSEVTVQQAKRQIIDGVCWCGLYESTADTAECNSKCDEFRPKEGKRPRCKYRGSFYEPVGEKITLTIKP